MFEQTSAAKKPTYYDTVKTFFSIPQPSSSPMSEDLDRTEETILAYMKQLGIVKPTEAYNPKERNIYTHIQILLATNYPKELLSTHLFKIADQPTNESRAAYAENLSNEHLAQQNSLSIR